MATHTIQVGDIAIITIGILSQEYTILFISDEGIMIDNRGNTSLLVPIGEDW